MKNEQHQKYRCLPNTATNFCVFCVVVVVGTADACACANK